MRHMVRHQITQFMPVDNAVVIRFVVHSYLSLVRLQLGAIYPAT
jgi:hypothetical protein